ncbi:MAG: hypothetical protein A2W03_14960 [Candidatus Aminicenantes bacterium RBG_16_63_16]|nr:MAG: hypothetical protein A2W03_14960 [Candidatus Aminicenantes bacterium RBG_16_63_16]
MNKGTKGFGLILSIWGGVTLLGAYQTPSPTKVETSASVVAEPQSPRAYSLQECLEVALQNNRWRPASQFAVEVAEAQHKQVTTPAV